MKIIRTYQQTFVSGVDAVQWLFKFNKLYKQDPKNKFQISCSCLASTDTAVSPKPHIFFASGLQAVNSSNSNVSPFAVIDASGNIAYESNASPQFNTNDFFLGVLGGGVNAANNIRGDIWIVNSPKIIVNDLPLDNITIYYRHPDTDNATKYVNSLIDGVFFAFEINEISNE